MFVLIVTAESVYNNRNMTSFFCSGSTNDKTKMSVTDKLQLMLLKDYPPICSLLPFVVALIHPTSTTTKQL